MSIGYFVYGHSEYDDLWDITFSRLKKYGQGFDDYYLFTDKVSKEIPDYITPITYDDNKLYSERLHHCLDRVNNEYVIYTHDDNFLRDHVDIEKIYSMKDLIHPLDISFIHLIRSGVPCVNRSGFGFLDLVEFDHEMNLYYLQDESKQFVGQPTLWDRKKFISVLSNNKAANTTSIERGEKSRDLESVETHNWMVENGVRGCYVYDSKVDKLLPPKNLSWTSSLFPTMNAVRKGRWYITEHKNELFDIFSEFNVDYKQRGLL